MKTLEIFDVSPYIHTAENVDKYASRYSYKFPVGGMQYFLKFLALNLKVNNDVILCFDSRSFRKDLSEKYKSSRKSAYPVYAQLDFLVEHLERCGIPCYKIDGYEADDLIHTAVFQNYKNYDLINIYGNDRDLAHNIIDQKVTLRAINSTTNTVNYYNFSKALVKGMYLPFNTISAYKVLTGDVSDEIEPFIAEDGTTGSQVYKEIVKLIMENPSINKYQITASRKMIDLVIKFKYRNFTENDLAKLKLNMDLVFPKRADKQMKAVNICDIDKVKLIELFRLVGAYDAMKCFGKPLLQTPEDRDYLAKRGQSFMNGEFAVDNDLPLTPLDSFGEVLFCREFD